MGPSIDRGRLQLEPYFVRTGGDDLLYLVQIKKKGITISRRL